MNGKTNNNGEDENGIDVPQPPKIESHYGPEEETEELEQKLKDNNES